jgi:hypothetical protein
VSYPDLFVRGRLFFLHKLCRSLPETVSSILYTHSHLHMRLFRFQSANLIRIIMPASKWPRQTTDSPQRKLSKTGVAPDFRMVQGQGNMIPRPSIACKHYFWNNLKRTMRFPTSAPGLSAIFGPEAKKYSTGLLSQNFNE